MGTLLEAIVQQLRVSLSSSREHGQLLASDEQLWLAFRVRYRSPLLWCFIVLPTRCRENGSPAAAARS